jgi:hypothetical protein
MKQNSFNNIIEVVLKGESICQDYELGDKHLNVYLQNLVMNFILKSLSKNDRISLYEILEKNNDNLAYKYLTDKIPEFNSKLRDHIKNNFVTILSK